MLSKLRSLIFFTLFPEPLCATAQGACDSATHQPTAQDVEVIAGEDGARVRRKNQVVASNQGVFLW